MPLYHWYEGAVPPLVGVAVKVTKVPATNRVHICCDDTPAVKIGLTIMVTVLDVAGDPDRQGAALEVITTVIISPLTGI